MDFNFSFGRCDVIGTSDVMNFHDEADFGMDAQQMGGPPQDLVKKILILMKCYTLIEIVAVPLRN